jgi:hypothetical protein
MFSLLLHVLDSSAEEIPEDVLQSFLCRATCRLFSFDNVQMIPLFSLLFVMHDLYPDQN